MPLDTRDIIQIGVLLLTAGGMYATVKAESKHQKNQHQDLKDTTERQSKEIGDRIESIRTSMIAVAGDSRDHGARITGLEGRVDRVESHVDNLRLRVGEHA